MKTQDKKTMVLFALFIGLLIGMNLLGGKLTTLFGVTLSVGIFMMPLTFLITDIIAEVHGKEMTKWFVYSGLFTLLIILAYISVFVALPPAERFTYNAEYATVFGLSIRITIASIIAFFFSQMHDIIAFEYWKKKTHGKMLWLRNNASTIVSQLIDTFIFMMIAFYHITPKFTVLFIISISIPFYIFKVLFALADTPFVYAGVKWLRK